ncbi:MAG TPA: methyltransferase domain-containing protein [Stellaceae bacterium]|nr:methyltransferase domain-containing protein [Stellaceae bacterium]
MAQAQTGGNTAQAEFWNSPAARAWADQHARMDRALAPFLEALLVAAAPKPGERVLDIGCGGGTTVLELAARVGPQGSVLGADIAERSVARARERIAAASLGHAEVVVADASAHGFPAGAFDLSFSRLGVMFFAEPTAAFTNIKRAMTPAARVVLGVFRAAAENLWPIGPTGAVKHLLPPLPTPGPEEPSPFSLADPSRVHRILEGAGFREVSLTPFDWAVRLAPPGGAAEAADFMMVFGPLTRVVPTLPAAQQVAVRAALEAYFEGRDGPDGVTLSAANWIVRART